MIGKTLGHFEIVDRLGQGGMGVVYKARDLQLDRLVALKLLPPELVGDPERRERFAREARAVAALSHPNIVTIFAVEEHDGTQLLAMEYVDGETLDKVLTADGLPLSRLFQLAIPIARALTAAHERRIVHRDLKPANVMIGADGVVKVLDFGLARMEALPTSDAGSAEAPTAALTRQGMMMGTIPYMAPEQVQGGTADHLSDIFSFGVLLFEMAAGRRPFAGDTNADLAASILRDTPQQVSDLRPELPRHLGRIIRHCLEKDPARRYQTALDVANELEDLRREVDSGEQVGARASLPRLVAEAKHKVHMSPLVGREAETVELERLLGQTATGQGSLVMIGGEPGVGKTRLVEELIRPAREHGFLTLVGHCYDTEGARPFSPWVEVLEYSSRVARREVLRQILGDGAPEVAKLLPELRRIFPDIPQPMALPPEQEQHHLFASFCGYLERSGQVQPLLIALEDLQWADESTLLLLQHLAPRLPDMSVMVVGTYRDVELDAARPLNRTLRQLVRERLMHRMALKRLTEADLSAMLRALAGQELPRPLLRALYARTEGNPFFVEEVFQHLKEEGALFDSDGRWRRDLAIEDLEVPEGVRLVVGRRLERLGEEARKALTAAAVIGRRFDFDLLEALGDFDSEALVDTVEEAEQLQLIQPVSGREIRFEFTQELVRQTLASGLSSLRRQRLHLRIAEAMEKVFAGDLENRASALAHHLFEAGAAADREKTVRYLALAGRQAVAAAALSEALRRFEDALTLVDTDDLATRADLLSRKGGTLRSLGRPEEAQKDWLEALPLYEQTADRDGVVRTALGAAAQILWSQRYRQGAELALRGVRFLGDEPSRGRIRLLGAAFTGLAQAGDLAAAEPMMREAFSSAESLRAGSRIQGELLQSKAWLHYAYMQYDECVDAGTRGAELLRDRDEHPAAATLAVTLLALSRTGRRAEAAALADRLEPVATRLGHAGGMYAVATHRAERALMERGDFATCLEHSDIILRRTRELGQLGDRARAMAGVAHLLAGHLEESVKELQEAAAIQTRHAAGSYLDGEAEGYLFVVRVWSGQEGAARALLEGFGDGLPRPGEPALSGSCWRLLGMVEGLAMLGERERAGALHGLVLESLRPNVVVRNNGYGLVRTVAGISAACAGHWDEAEEHFAGALRLADELPHVVEQAEIRRWWAWMLFGRGGDGDRDRARELQARTVEIYERLGMPAHLERARALV